MNFGEQDPKAHTLLLRNVFLRDPITKQVTVWYLSIYLSKGEGGVVQQREKRKTTNFIWSQVGSRDLRKNIVTLEGEMQLLIK